MYKHIYAYVSILVVITMLLRAPAAPAGPPAAPPARPPVQKKRSSDSRQRYLSQQYPPPYY